MSKSVPFKKLPLICLRNTHDVTVWQIVSQMGALIFLVSCIFVTPYQDRESISISLNSGGSVWLSWQIEWGKSEATWIPRIGHKNDIASARVASFWDTKLVRSPATLTLPCCKDPVQKVLKGREKGLRSPSSASLRCLSSPWMLNILMITSSSLQMAPAEAEWSRDKLSLMNTA